MKPFFTSLMLLAGLAGISAATTGGAPQAEENAAGQLTAAIPLVTMERAVFHQENAPFSLVVDLGLDTEEPGMYALPDRIVELEVKDDAGHSLKADWQIDNAGMELLWPTLDASVWVSTPIIGKWVDVSGKLITLISSGSDIRRMVVTAGQPCTIALEGHIVTCTDKTAEDGSLAVELTIKGEHIAYITGIRFLSAEGEGLSAKFEDSSMGFTGESSAAIDDVYRYRLSTAPERYTIEFTVQKPQRIEAVPFCFCINAPDQADNRAKLLQQVEKVRAEAAAIEQMPTELLAEIAELWALYRECRLGDSDLTPLQERIAQIKQPKRLYAIASFFESCMPDLIHLLPDAAEGSDITEAQEQVECTSALWSARSVVRGYCQQNLLAMAKEGNEEALVYLHFLARTYPGATEPEGVDYYEESSKLIKLREEQKK